MSAHALLRFGVSRLLASSAPSANVGLVAGQRVIFGSSTIKGFSSSAPAAMTAAAATQAAPVPPPPPRGNPANVSARVVSDSPVSEVLQEHGPVSFHAAFIFL